jgi:hypothetical protein
MGSRLTTGFHRIGLVVAVPCLMAAVVMAWAEWESPSGPLKPFGFPKKVFVAQQNADMPAENRKIFDLLRKDQEAAGVRNEPDVIVGRVLKDSTEADPNQPEATRVSSDKWTLFLLRDGREVIINSVEFNDVAEATIGFLVEEKKGRSFKWNDQMEFEGIRAVFADQSKAVSMAKWPFSDRQRQPDWFLAITAALIGIGFYGAMRSIAWVINGFVEPRSATF